MRARGVRRGLVVGLALAVTGVSGYSAFTADAASAEGLVANLKVTSQAAGLSKIKHVVIFMQENHSFDSYFGMYPGADGIPVDAQGHPTVCVNDPKTGSCVYPWHDPEDISNGGPHGETPANKDINGGRMDGFIGSYQDALRQCEAKPGSPHCGYPKPQPDVMSYKLRSDIPEYWSYADNYVLMDHMFGSGRTWSLPEHLSLVSSWSARCYKRDDPMSCENELDSPDDARFESNPNYAWTDLTHLMNQQHVPWGYYVFTGSEPDCQDPDDIGCIPLPQSYRTGSIWNPLPNFTTVQQEGTLGNIQTVDNFASAAQNGTLPAVSWVLPTNTVSEHPPAKLTDGRNYMSYMVNQVMQGPDWDSTAMFITWDEWGGFYDHVVPPTIDANGLGIRVPGILISPYAKQGYIDHSVHTFESYTKFIEDVFLGGARLDPTTDGRPDTRPTVRENAPQIADLMNDFDFTKPPRPPAIVGNTDADKVNPAVHPKPATIHASTVKSSATTIAPKQAVKAAAATSVTGTAPFDAVLDGTASTGGSSTIKRWSMRFGDKTTLKGKGQPKILTHRYPAAGTYHASLHVYDTHGASAVAKVVVKVKPAAPTVWISGNKPLGFDDLTESFNASASSSGNWTISFGDGTAPVTGTGRPPANLSHHFSHVGIYSTTLTVVDPVTGLSNVARAISTVSASRAPTVTTKTPDIGPNDAQLGMNLWTNGKATKLHFEWGTDPSHLTNFTPTRNAPMGASSPGQKVTGLIKDTKYYFRAVATNSVGTTYGDIRSFTPNKGPKIFTITASSIGRTSVTLNGSVNPGGSDTQVWWLYGVGGNLGQTTQPQDIGDVKAKQVVSTPVTGLQPGTTYSFRFVAENGVGQTTSGIQTFTTAS